MSVDRSKQLFAELLASFGHPATGDLADTPDRAARLWHEELLKGEGVAPATALGRGLASSSRAPVLLRDVAIHLVCPHHLTIGFGAAHVAYAPGGRLASFGGLVKLVEACTCRLVLQEEAAHNIASALVEHLGARAAVAQLSATHPCHNVPHARALHSSAESWGEAGDPEVAARLVRLLRAPSTRGTSDIRSPARPRARGGRGRRRGAR
jgi:GTP cyclohydrolase IA